MHRSERLKGCRVAVSGVSVSAWVGGSSVGCCNCDADGFSSRVVGAALFTSPPSGKLGSSVSWLIRSGGRRDLGWVSWLIRSGGRRDPGCRA